jgi:hypothetical protein
LTMVLSFELLLTTLNFAMAHPHENDTRCRERPGRTQGYPDNHNALSQIRGLIALMLYQGGGRRSTS